MKFRKHFDYDVTEASVASGVDFTGIESLTIQSMAEDADINVLMDRYGITGKMPENPRVPMYGDFTGVKDYQSALNAVGQAYDDFMELPAKLRARFNNNPQDLLAFCADDANIEEARSLGLLKEKDNGQSDTGGGSGTPGGVKGRSTGKGAGDLKVPAGGSKAPPGDGEETA